MDDKYGMKFDINNMKKVNLLIIMILSLFVSACIDTRASHNEQLIQSILDGETSSVMPQSSTVPIDVRLIHQPFLSRSDVQDFIAHHSVVDSQQYIDWLNLFSGSKEQIQITRIMDKPGTSKPWYEFHRANVGGRVVAGKEFIKKNQSVLSQVAQYYRIPVELIVAIMGIETNYGRSMGKYRIGDVLTTLAFDYPRRSEFFQKELVEFFQLAHEEQQDIFSFRGSYAGAMGIPQFMPSSYRKWAVDWDHDGHRDIWSNVGDAAASVAHYLNQHGWQVNQQISTRVWVNDEVKILPLLSEPTSLKHTVGELRSLGVMIPNTITDSEKAILFRLEISAGVYEYWVGLNNFYTIWHYNNSRLYVQAVREIANGLGANL